MEGEASVSRCELVRLSSISTQAASIDAELDILDGFARRSRTTRRHVSSNVPRIKVEFHILCLLGLWLLSFLRSSLAAPKDCTWSTPWSLESILSKRRHLVIIDSPACSHRRDRPFYSADRLHRINITKANCNCKLSFSL